MAVSKRLRYEVLRRDNHSCRYCGLSAPATELVVDHVIPVALGGKDEPSNLVAACRDCNAGKSATNPDSPLIADVEQDAVRWAAAMKRAQAESELDGRLQDEVSDFFEELWWESIPQYRLSNPGFQLPDDFAISLLRFVKQGITPRDIEQAIRIAIGSPAHNKFRYFCGVLHRKIDDLQARAMQIVREDPNGA